MLDYTGIYKILDVKKEWNKKIPKMTKELWEYVLSLLSKSNFDERLSLCDKLVRSIGQMDPSDKDRHRYLKHLAYLYGDMTCATRIWYAYHIRCSVNAYPDLRADDELASTLSFHRYVYKGEDEILGPKKYLQRKEREAFELEIKMRG